MARGSVLADLSASTVSSRAIHYVNAAYAHEFVLQDVWGLGRAALCSTRLSWHSACIPAILPMTCVILYCQAPSQHTNIERQQSAAVCVWLILVFALHRLQQCRCAACQCGIALGRAVLSAPNSRACTTDAMSHIC